MLFDKFLSHIFLPGHCFKWSKVAHESHWFTNKTTEVSPCKSSKTRLSVYNFHTFHCWYSGFTGNLLLNFDNFNWWYEKGLENECFLIIDTTFCRKTFPGLTKKFLHIFVYLWGLKFEKNHVVKPVDSFNKCKKIFCQAWKLFSAEIWKLTEFHFWADIMLKQPRVRSSRASPAQKLQGFRVIYSKKCSRTTFFVFWGTHSVDRFLSYLL